MLQTPKLETAEDFSKVLDSFDENVNYAVVFVELIRFLEKEKSEGVENVANT